MVDITKRNAAGMSLQELREDYRLASLDERNCETNPIRQFQKWFQDAKSAHLKEPNAMTLATATRDGRPSGRIVLLKEFSDAGFFFYTNYDSRKGIELETNPICALTFFWGELERQVRIEGGVTKVAPEKSEEYFRSRPRGSRLGAWVSNQSAVLAGRESLEIRLAELEAKYTGSDDIPPPGYWGGYCVQPDTIEFWQGRSNRLHDRILYRNEGQAAWSIQRLAP